MPVTTELQATVLDELDELDAGERAALRARSATDEVFLEPEWQRAWWRVYGAGELATFRAVRIPNSLPFMFTGLKVAAVLSMIGAIVGEYFGGPTNALGVSILNDTQLFNFPRAWAGIALASAFGIAFYGAVALAERLTTGWQPSARGFRGE